MAYADRIRARYKIPSARQSAIHEAVNALDAIRLGVIDLEEVLGLDVPLLTSAELKRLDKVVTVVKVGLKVGKHALRLHDPKYRKSA